MEDITTVQISPADLQKLRQKIKQLFLGENRPSGQSPMHSRCKVAVLVPVYNEDITTIMRPLLSLARQENIGKEEFEVVLVVNNSRFEAENRTPEFLKNQEALDFLRHLSGGKISSGNWQNEQAATEEIKNSGLRIAIIDKSSIGLSDPENHVAHARNRGCLEITARFLDNGQNENGIIAMTDSDCRLSAGYIRSIIDAFSRHRFLNGLNGALEHEVDQSLPYYQAVKQAFDAHAGFFGRSSPAKKYTDGIAFKKCHKINYEPLNTGQDIAVRVKSWLLCGGFPDRPSGEDYHFGRLVEALEGDIGVTDNYTVFPLVRLSERTGLAGQGRRVGKIVGAVKDFYEGKNSVVRVPDLGGQKKLFLALSEKSFAGTLTGQEVARLFLESGCDISGKEDVCGQLASVMNQEMAKPDDERDYAKMENFVAEHFGACLPTKDVTDMMNNSQLTLGPMLIVNGKLLFVA